MSNAKSSYSPPPQTSEINEAIADMEQDAKEVRYDSDLELLNRLNRSDIESIESHNLSYKSLLNVYLNSMGNNLIQKSKMKKSFFVISCIIMVSVCILEAIGILFPFVSVLLGYSLSAISCIPLVSSLISFFTVFIIIPQIIAKHLFNDKDENIMTNIFKDIQDYDKYIRNIFKSSNSDKF